MSNGFSKDETSRLQKYIRGKFSNENISLVERQEAQDSLEVLLSGEHLGIIYKNEDEGELSYDFNMTVLEIDLQEAA